MMRHPLNRILMEEIGLSVDKKNCIIDQDTREPMLYGGKSLKYSSKYEIPITNADIKFDPAYNKNLMVNLFKYFLSKIEAEDEIYVKTYSEVPKEDGTSALCLDLDDKRYMTKFYRNPTFKYIEMIQVLNCGEITAPLDAYDAVLEEIHKNLKE